MKFNQDLCLNLWYDQIGYFGKMNSTLGSVVPLAMFLQWVVPCHGGFSWLFRPLFRRLLNLSWTGASLLKGLQSARSRLLHQNCTRNAKPFAQCENVNFFKTPAQLLYHIVQYARTKGEAGTKVKPLGQLTFALKISISPFNLKGAEFFYKAFVKPSSFLSRVTKRKW